MGSPKIIMRFVLAAVALSISCATGSQVQRKASDYSNAGDYDQAVSILKAEIERHPKSPELRTLLYRAMLNSYYYHLALARDKVKVEDLDAARKEYETALAIFPGNSSLKEEMDTRLIDKKKRREKPEQSLIEPPVQLAVNSSQKIDLAIANNPITNIFKALGKNFGINFIFDREFRDFIHSVEIKSKNFYDILLMLCLISNSQYRVVDPSTVLIYPDQPYKKQLFDLKAIKVFYLSHAKAEDAKKILSALFAASGQGTLIQEDPNLNALIVKADIETLKEIEKFLPNIDIQKSEVQIDIEIIEINRSKLRELGAKFGSSFTLTPSLATPSEDTTNIIDLASLNKTNFYLTVPSIALNLLETGDNSKAIAKPNLRGLDGEKISYMVGDEVPIAQTQYGNVAAGGVTTVPITTYQYRNVGVEIKITPFIHRNNEVTLDTELTINFLSGSAINTDFPILGKREIKAKFRLKENETNIIGGLIRDDIRRSMSGLPALSRIPILGRLFGSGEDTIRQTDLIFSITPRIISKTPYTDKNLAPIWLDTGDTASGSAGIIAEPPTGRVQTMPSAIMPTPGGKSSLSITPPQTRVPVGSEATFSVSVQSDSPIFTMALRGTLQGSGEIVEVSTDFFDPSVKTMKYLSGSSLTAGYTFSDLSKPLQNSMVLQIRAKFSARGTATLTVESSGSMDYKQRAVSLSPASAKIDVY